MNFIGSTRMWSAATLFPTAQGPNSFSMRTYGHPLQWRRVCKLCLHMGRSQRRPTSLPPPSATPKPEQHGAATSSSQLQGLSRPSNARRTDQGAIEPAMHGERRMERPGGAWMHGPDIGKAHGAHADVTGHRPMLQQGSGLGRQRWSHPPGDGQRSHRRRSEQSLDAQQDLGRRLADGGAAAPGPSPPPPLVAPPSPTFRAADKAYMKPEERRELARRLRRAEAAAAAGRPPLRVFRHAVDDLRLFRALEAAGLAGRVVVADSLQHADVVLATRHKRTGKDVSLVEVRRAAGNAGLPFVELAAVSALKVAQALAPMMGLAVPAQLLQPRRDASSAARLPRLRDLHPQGPPPDPPPPLHSTPAAGGVLEAGRQPASVYLADTDQAEAPDWGGLLKVAPPQASSGSRDAPSDLLDAVDAKEDRRGLLPLNRYDLQGRRHALRRQGAPNGRAKRRTLVRELGEESAPW